MDHEACKTSLLCKWVIKAMNPSESNLLLMLRYIYVGMLQPTKREKLGLGWIGTLESKRLDL